MTAIFFGMGHPPSQFYPPPSIRQPVRHPPRRPRSHRKCATRAKGAGWNKGPGCHPERKAAPSGCHPKKNARRHPRLSSRAKRRSRAVEGSRAAHKRTCVSRARRAPEDAKARPIFPRLCRRLSCRGAFRWRRTGSLDSLRSLGMTDRGCAHRDNNRGFCGYALQR